MIQQECSFFRKTREFLSSQFTGTVSMAMYTLDQKRLLDLHAKLDHATYAVGKDSDGKLKGKAKNSAEPDKISKLDCSGYVKYVLYNVSDGKIDIKGGSYYQYKWCKEQKLKKVDYAKAAKKSDNILRLGYFAKKKKGKYGHVWLILNGKTLESHGGTGVNRRPWNNKKLLDNVTHCYEVATTSVASPAKYRLSARVKDPEIRRILEAAIDNDKRINYYEVVEILLGVIGDGKISTQELKDLKSIFQYSKSLHGPGKALMENFITSAPRIMAEMKKSAPTPKKNGNASPTEKANAELYRRHPELKGRALTSKKSDAALRKEWMQLYRKYGGK